MRRIAPFLFLAFVTLVGCRPEFNDSDCTTAQDCFPGEFCVSGTCQGSGSSNNVNNVNNSNISTIEISPATGELDVGATLTFTAIARDVSGNVVDTTFDWTVNDVSIATVSANGVVTGVAVGEATITAGAGSASGSATVTVSQIPVASITIEPDMAVVARNRTVTLTAQPLDADGNALLGRIGTWTSADPAIATVGQLTGEVNGIELGTTTITVEMEGFEATASIEVVAEAVATVNLTPAQSTVQVGNTTQLNVVTLDDMDNELMNRVVNYVSDDPTIASVDATGLVTGVSPGNAMITATSEGISDTVMVTVEAIPVATVIVSPATATLRDNNDTVQLTAELRDVNDNVLVGRTVVWESLGVDYATVDQNGLVTGVMLEPMDLDVIITATSENVVGQSAITIIPAVVTVNVLPVDPDIVIPNTLQATANVLDAMNNALNGRTVTWMSSDDTVATVDMNGLITPVAAGTADITATSENINGVTTVTVMGPVANVVVNPAAATIAIAGTQQITADPQDAGANSVNDTVTWATDNAAVATVDGNGLVTGVAVGTANITATSDSNGAAVGTTVITVQ